MFSSLGLFQNLPCPDQNNCTRVPCIFSHRTDLPAPPLLYIPIDEPRTVSLTSQTPPLTQNHKVPTTVPAKRSVIPSPSRAESSAGRFIGEPPRKIQKLGLQKQVAVPSTTYTSTGVPILKINAVQSQVALPVRQAMLKSLYDHFVVLYDSILPNNPTLASEHALKQEEEVYKKSNKLTYRNAVITSIASLKKRSLPNSISHPSVGTEGDLAARAESRKSLDSLRLTRAHLNHLILTMAGMQQWGYITDVPEGPGGDRCHEVGKFMKCERCGQPFTVSRRAEPEECLYHWGKQYTRLINGEKTRIYTCCSRPIAEGAGCVHGPHVFYDSKPEELHSRHPFSYTRPAALPRQDATPRDRSIMNSAATDTALDVVALDCEMVYTTGGMRVARVSVVDGAGTQVFDELVRMDDDVEVIDYNTRFSGITAGEHAKALLPLGAIRKSLDALINSQTIMIGHALDNDLKALRIIHHQCVDTVVLFPHRAGLPYRRALRELVKEHLGRYIQTGGGTVGHSSVEDSIATLDLVRWYVLNRPKQGPNSNPTTLVASGTSVIGS